MLRSGRQFLFLTFVLGSLSGCGDDLAAPTGFSAAAPASTTASVAAATKGASVSAEHKPTPVKCAAHAPYTRSHTFGPAGGTLYIGWSRLVIPRGALTMPVKITATAVGDSSSTISFQPEGLHFQQPVGLVLDGSRCNIPPSATPDVVYLGNDGQVDEVIGASYDAQRKRVIAPIQHFSGYAIAF